MSHWLVVGLSAALGCLIIGLETARQRDWLALDFMRLASGVYFIAFVILPIYVTFVDLRAFPDRAWDWVFRNQFGGEAYALAAALALLAYVLMALGYRVATARTRHRAPAPSPFALVTPRYLFGVGAFLAAVGGLAMLLYVRDIGGMLVFLISGVASRTGAPPRESPLAFLKNVMLLLLGASYCFYALRADPRAGRLRGAALLLFGVTAPLALLALFHHAGRVQLVTFLISFPVAGMIRRGRVRTRTAVIAGVGFVAFILFGRQLFSVVTNPAGFLSQWESLREDSAYTLNLFLLEFVFPVVTLANTVVSVPDLTPYRWFVDVPLGLLYLVPQRLLGIRHPRGVSMINTELFATFGGIPVDVVSLGYFSAGLAGVLVVAFGFGWLIAWFERLLPPSPDPLFAVFRSIWMFFVAFRVMYADPVQVSAAGFYLMVTTGLLLAPRVLRWLRPLPIAAHAAPGAGHDGPDRAVLR